MYTYSLGPDLGGTLAIVLAIYCILVMKLPTYRIAGKFGEHYIWRISQWKIFGDFNFDDDLPAGLASRLSSCTYRYACAASF